MAGAMPNGRCRMHGGNAAAGRAHGRFRHGRRSRAAIDAHAEARALRKMAWDEFTQMVMGTYPPTPPNTLAWKVAKQRLYEKLEQANKVKWSWVDLFYPRDPAGNIIWQPLGNKPTTRRRPKLESEPLPEPPPKPPRKRRPRDVELRSVRRMRAAQEFKRLAAIDEAAERERERAEKVAEWRKVGKEPVK
jgi:hypothetical protein